MTQLRTFLCAVLVTALSYGLGFAAGDQAIETAGDTERFPILTRFELPRDYGYFIGDEIPLTLVVETSQGVVLDLVNLPKQGETHGPIRDSRLTAYDGTPYPGGNNLSRCLYSPVFWGHAPHGTVRTSGDPLCPVWRSHGHNAYLYL